MSTKQIEEDVVEHVRRMLAALLAALLAASLGMETIDAIDRELDAAERASAVPTHPNFGRARK
jgi:hypothetical protein